MGTWQGSCEEIRGAVRDLLRQGQLLTKQRAPEGGKLQLERREGLAAEMWYAVYFQKLWTGNHADIICITRCEWNSFRGRVDALFPGTQRLIPSQQGIQPFERASTSSYYSTKTPWEAGEAVSYAASVTFHSEGLKCCSVVRFQQLFSKVFDLFEDYFFNLCSFSTAMLKIPSDTLSKSVY